MFEFRWQAGTQVTREITLRIHARKGWIGRKRLECDGQPIYARGPFDGIVHRWVDPVGGDEFRLQLKRDPADGNGRAAAWRPVLLCNGVEVPERSGTAPPLVVPPPKPIAVTAAVVYVTILLLTVSYIPITRVLSALYLNHDDRRLLLVVHPSESDPDALRVVPSVFAPHAADTGLMANDGSRPFRGQLQAVGGTPPYEWRREKNGWPRGISLDPISGELQAGSIEPDDYSGTFRVRDAAGDEVTGSFVIRGPRDVSDRPDRPKILTESLPPATVGEPYEFALTAAGGLPAARRDEVEYVWSMLGRGMLPKGLQLNRSTGVISGTPTVDTVAALIVRVADRSYAPADSTRPWVIPVLATAICLIGLLQMRRTAVFVFLLVIAAQAAFLLTGLLPISVTALAVQAGLWLLGAAYRKGMH